MKVILAENTSVKMKNKKLIFPAAIIYTGFLAFWAIIALQSLQGETDTAEIFSALYGGMALFGGVTGLVISRYWGGFKSKIGRSVAYISLGLLAQEVGQVTYSLYTYLFNQEIPYPSLGDIGYFGSVIFYILGAFTLVKALSTGSTLKSRRNKFWVALIPLVLLSASYYIFLRGYTFDFHHPVTILLDFGYPLGQAVYISLALIVFVLSKKYLGGIMKPVILFLLFSLCLQYLADFTFLYQTSRKTWQTAGINELMYLTSYFVMTLSLVTFKTAFDRIRGKN